MDAILTASGLSCSAVGRASPFTDESYDTERGAVTALPFVNKMHFSKSESKFVLSDLLDVCLEIRGVPCLRLRGLREVKMSRDQASDPPSTPLSSNQLPEPE